MSKKYVIEEELRGALLNFLAEQPYKDVWMGVDGLKSLVEIPPVEEKDE